MGLQLFSKRKWEDDSFNETNVTSVLRDAKEKRLEILSSINNLLNNKRKKKRERLL